MAIRVVRLGTDRQEGEGLRIGTVRRPPRGVSKTEFASRNFFDVWMPMLAPSEPVVIAGQHVSSDKALEAFVRRYRAEMRAPDAARLLDLLAALSHDASFSVGCYCEQEQRCHRSVLRELLVERGASIAVG